MGGPRAGRPPCRGEGGVVFVSPHMSPPAPTTLDLLTAVAEPTRLRILNCLAAAPLVVSDLQALLNLPQSTVSRHLKVLRECGVVRDTQVGQFVLYRPGPLPAPLDRVRRSLLQAAMRDSAHRSERRRARALSRRAGSARFATDLKGRIA